MTSYVLCKTGSLAVFKVTARDQGHYKGPSGAFVTYCNISCFLMFAILPKTVFCLQFLLLKRPPFSYMNSDPCFYFFFSQIICIYITYRSDTKISSTEVTLIFAIVSNFSDLPLHSMQKCIKSVVLLDRASFVPSVGDIVFYYFF